MSDQVSVPTADARDLWRICSHAVIQHASWFAGKRHARYEAAKSNKGVGLKLGLSETTLLLGAAIVLRYLILPPKAVPTAATSRPMNVR